MQLVIVETIVELFGKWLSNNAKESLTSAEISSIKQRKFSFWYELLYVVYLVGLITLLVGIFSLTIIYLGDFYNQYHNLLLDQKTPLIAVIIGILMSFVFIFWVGYLYSLLVLKFSSSKFKELLLREQIKSGYKLSLEENMSITFKLAIILSLVLTPINILLFVFF